MSQVALGYDAIVQGGWISVGELIFFLITALVCFRVFRSDIATNDAEAGTMTRVLVWLRLHRGFTVFALITAVVAALLYFIEGAGAAANSVAALVLLWFVLSLVFVGFLRGFLNESLLFFLYPLSALLVFRVDLELIRILDGIRFSVGTYTVSAWGIIAGVATLIFLIWLGLGLSKVLEHRIRQVKALSPSLQVLVVKIVRMVLLFLAVVIAVSSVGVDLTALTVFGGAIGLGLGFGLQKIVSNLVCGFILLTDKSVKPGDVIEIGSTYGWINNLNARYVSVITRDGTEHLIPNEDLVTQRVVNWSFTDNLVRIRTPVGISYKSDPHHAMRVIREVVEQNARILKDPPPNILVTGFGDSSVDLEVRCWISDPVNGIGNVRSALLLGIWDAFKAHGIEIPFPQRDLHIRSDIRESAVDLVPKSAVKPDDTSTPSGE